MERAPLGAQGSSVFAGPRATIAAVVGIGVVAALAVAMLASRPAAAQEVDRFDNAYCLGCHAADGMSTTLPGGEVLELTVSPEVYGDSVHGRLELSCVLCHNEIEGFPHDPITAQTGRDYTIDSNQVCSGCHVEQFTATQDNVHADALAAGNHEAAACSDCHGAHNTRAPQAHSNEIPRTCRTCHAAIYDLYEESVHGEVLETGNPDVPTCTDCHGVHELEGPGEDSPFHLFSPQICAECHANEELMARYSISTQVFDTYIADFHGETVVLFEELAPDQETNKPVCIDCHGVHAIKPSEDPDSTVNKSHLLQTCQRCHPDAAENFPASWLSHYIPEPGEATVVFGVQLFYRIFIPLVLGGMALYVILHWIRHIPARRKARQHG